MKVAFLVYKAWRVPRRKDTSFDGVSNIGAYVLKDVAERNGQQIEFCSVDSADQFDIVLVSLTSIYDVLAFYQQVKTKRNWQRSRRKFRVLAGGFGLQNPLPIVEYVDSFWFGRCEDYFMEWLNTPDFNHESCLNYGDNKVCKIHQTNIYPFEISLPGKNIPNFSESIMGCPNKCFFCHFSFARKHIATSKHYNLSLYSSSQELDMFNFDEINNRVAMFTFGMDGFSERLRFAVNKKTTNERIISLLEKISVDSQTQGKGIYITLYNISGYEGENSDDLAEFFKTFGNVKNLKKRLIVTVHTTLLHPSPATPLVYSKVNLDAPLLQSGKILINSPLLCLGVSLREPSPFALLESLVVERFTEKERSLLDNICFNTSLKNLKTSDKLTWVRDNFDLTDLVREYDVNERVPSWMCESYYGWESIKNLRKLMIKEQYKYGLR